MDSVISKIFAGEIDNFVHMDFIRFSKGVFKNKYLLEGKKQKSKWSIKTGAEFGNYLVKKCLSGVSGSLKFKGIIVSTLKLKDEVDFEIVKVKQFMGIKQLVIDTEIDVSKILDMMSEHPKAFFALSFETDNCKLKIKAKAPKGAKPSGKGGGLPKADFCSIKTSEKSILNDLFFDYPHFEEISVNHTITIKDIKLPEGETDPVMIRKLAKKVGSVKRSVIVDGEEKVSEKDFVV